jgi:putative flippase GtrA
MISNLEIEKIVLFLVVGTINTLFGLGVYCFFLYAGLSYPLASLLSLLAGVLFSYNNHSKVVFKSRGRFLVYVLVWFFIYIVNIALISAIRNYIGDYFAGIAILPVIIILSYVLMKWLVFRPFKEIGI